MKLCEKKRQRETSVVNLSFTPKQPPGFEISITKEVAYFTKTWKVTSNISK